MNTGEAVLEAFVDFEREVSVVAARGIDGSMAAFPVIENAHRNHILEHGSPRRTELEKTENRRRSIVPRWRPRVYRQGSYCGHEPGQVRCQPLTAAGFK